MTDTPVQWIKNLLSKSLDWPDMPIKTEGRVILKKWPASETLGTKSTIVAPPSSRDRRVNGVAWVYRAIGPAANILHRGDSVIIPAAALDAGAMFPCEDGSLADYREVAAEDILHFLPYDDALATDVETRAAVETAFLAAVPAINEMLDYDQIREAGGALLEWAAKASFLSPAAADVLLDLNDRVQKAVAKMAYESTKNICVLPVHQKIVKG